MQRTAGLSHLPKIFVSLTMIISLTVIYGWITHDISLVKLGPRLPPMVFNTGLFFLLYSFNLIIDRSKHFTLLSIMNTILMVFSFLTILEYALNVNFGIDELFFKDNFLVDLTHPGRMGPNTALGFIVFSIAFLFRPINYSRFRLRNMFPLVFFSFATLIGLMSLFGFVFSAERGYIWGSFTRMALQTGLCFLFLGLACIIKNISSLDYMNAIEEKTKKLILFVVSSVIGLTVFIWFLFCSLDAHKINEIVKSENARLHNAVSLTLKDRLESLERMAARLERKKLTRAEWDLEAAQLVRHFEGLDSLILMDEKGKILYSLSTHEGVKALVEDSLFIEAIKKSQLEKKPLYSSGFLDISGKAGFISVVPYFSKGTYQGALIGHYIGQDFFKSILGPSDLLVTIKAKEVPLFSNILPKTPVIEEWSYKSDLAYSGIILSTVIIPAKKIISTHLGVTPTIVLVIGVFLSILMAAFIAAIYELRVARNRHAYMSQWQRAILNGTDLAIVSTDIYGNVVLLNPAAEQLLGYSEKEIVGKMKPSIWHDEKEILKKAQERSEELGRVVRPGVETFFARAIDGITDKEKWTIYKKNGERRQVILSVHALRSNDDEINGFLGVLEDITEKEKQQQLIEEQRMKMVASSKMSSLGEMAAGIAHEINNPLTVIKGMAKMIKLSSESGTNEGLEVISRSSDTIENTVNRIAKIIGSLKSFARDSGHEEVAQTSINNILDETIPFCLERFRNENIDLRIKGEDQLVVSCRPIQISQVLLNLLNNAHDAISTIDEKWVEIEIVKNGSMAIISVTDSGHGITEDVEQKMMIPFFTTKDVGKGTGLGLSISAGIVESHQGRLYYDRSSKHTRFVVELPCS